MELLTHEITLGFSNETGILNIPISQRDVNRIISIGFTDYGEEYEIPQNTNVFLKARKPDGTEINTDEFCSIVDNKVQLQIFEQLSIANGTVQCEMILSDENGTHYTSNHFNLIVNKSVHNDENLRSSDTYKDIIKILLELKNINEHENDRIRNEEERIIKENSRIQNENQRILKENTRLQSENERNLNETQRRNAETIRNQNEDQRVSNENIRKTDEIQRITNEDERNSKEVERVTSESIRNQNENQRVSNENERSENEIQRINAETERIAAENERKNTFSTVLNTTKSYSDIAKQSSKEAKLSEENAENSALESESWAHGKTGIRENENTNNSEFWCKQSEGLNEESKKILEHASALLDEASRKILSVSFDVTDEGELLYESEIDIYDFTINDDGELEYFLL